MNTTTRIAAMTVVIAISYGAGAWAHTIQKGDIQIIHPWVEPSESYSTRTHPTISNEEDDPITLVGAETSIAEQVLIIREGLVLERLVIAGEDVVSFGEDGLYITLVGLKEPLEDGAHFPVTFHFDGESLEFHMVVGESTMMPGMEMAEAPGDDTGGMHEMHGGGGLEDEGGLHGHGDKHGDDSDGGHSDHHGLGDEHGALHDSEESDEHAAAHDANTLKETILTITHAPIEAIGWPEMTTDFSLVDEANVADVNVGDRVYFVLVADSDGIYAVKLIGQVDRGVPPTSNSELLGEGVVETIAGRKL